MVVEERPDLASGNAGIDVGIEDLEKIAESLHLGLVTERGKVLERLVVPVEVVRKGDRIQSEVRPNGRLRAVGGQPAVFHVLD